MHTYIHTSFIKLCIKIIDKHITYKYTYTYTLVTYSYNIDNFYLDTFRSSGIHKVKCSVNQISLKDVTTINMHVLCSSILIEYLTITSIKNVNFLVHIQNIGYTCRLINDNQINSYVGVYINHNICNHIVCSYTYVYAYKII